MSHTGFRVGFPWFSSSCLMSHQCRRSCCTLWGGKPNIKTTRGGKQSSKTMRKILPLRSPRRWRLYERRRLSAADFGFDDPATCGTFALRRLCLCGVGFSLHPPVPATAAVASAEETKGPVVLGRGGKSKLNRQGARSRGSNRVRR